MKRLATGFLLLMVLAFSAPLPAAAIDSFFDVFADISVQGPPFPTDAIITIIGTNFGPDFHREQEVSNGIAGISLNGLPPGEPWIGRAAGGGTGGLPPTIDSFFDVFTDYQLPPGTPVLGTLRRISDVRIVHPPGTPPGTRLNLVPINPGAPPGSVDSFFDVFFDDAFFDITYRVADPTGEHTYHEHGTSPGGRMSFFDVFVEMLDQDSDNDGHFDSFFDVFVDFRLNGLPPGEPVLRFHTTGTSDPNPVPVVGATWSGIKSLLH